MAAVRKAQVVESSQPAPCVRVIRFRMTEPPELPYRAGNYIILQGKHESGIRKHAYCYFSAPSRFDTFELCAKVTGGLVSSYLDNLKPGDEIAFGGPYGSFVAPDEDSGPLVYICTGTGISAVHSHLGYLLGRNYASEIRLFWGLRTEDDIFMREQLEAWHKEHPYFTFQVALSKPKSGGTGRRVTQAVPEALADLTKYRYFLSGNGAMIRDMTAVLAQAGVPGDRIAREAFFTPVREAG